MTLSAENKVDLIAANMSSNQGSLPGNVYNVHLGLHQINGSVDKGTFHMSYRRNVKIVKKKSLIGFLGKYISPPIRNPDIGVW